MFGLFFDKNYEECLSLLGINRFTNKITYCQLLSARDKNKGLSNSNPNEAAARTFRDLVILNEQLPIEDRIVLCLEKLTKLKIWYFDGKVNENLFLAIKEDLDGLIEEFAGNQYLSDFYQALSKMGVIVPITHDQLRTYSLVFVVSGTKNQYTAIEAAKKFIIDVVAKNVEHYSNCVKEEVKEIIFVLSKDPAIPAHTFSLILDSVVQQNSATHQNNTPSVTKSISATRCSFRIGDGKQLAPIEFGAAAVALSIDGSQECLAELVDTNQSMVQKEISSKAAAVRLHLVALQTAALYVVADKLSSDDNVLLEIAEGIVQGYTALFTDEDGKLMGANNPRNLYELFRDYAKSLTQELNEITPELLPKHPNNWGPNSILVVDNIVGQCNIGVLVRDNPAERARLEKIVSKNGISLLLRLLLTKTIAYDVGEL